MENCKNDACLTGTCGSNVNCCSTKEDHSTTVGYDVSVSVREPKVNVISATSTWELRFPISYSETDKRTHLGSGGGSEAVATIVETSVGKNTYRQLIRLEGIDSFEKYAKEVLDIILPKFESLNIDVNQFIAAMKGERPEFDQWSFKSMLLNQIRQEALDRETAHNARHGSASRLGSKCCKSEVEL